MRYYRIQFQAQKGQTVPSSIAKYLLFTSYKNPTSSIDSFFNSDGKNNGGAFEIEFHVEVGPIDQAIPNGFLRIYNPPIEAIDNAAAFQGLNVIIWAGFSDDDRSGFKTVKSANINQLKPIGSGTVFMSFANWMAGDRALDFYIGPSISSSGLLSIDNQTTTYHFLWAPNGPFQALDTENLTVAALTLGQALRNTFVSENSVIKDVIFIVATGDKDLKNLPTNKLYEWQGSDLTDFGVYLRQITSEQLNSGQNKYLYGLSMVLKDNNIYILDSNNPNVTSVLDIPSTNIIGQPTITYNNGALEIQTVHPLNANIAPNGMGIRINIDNRFIVTNANKAANAYKSINIRNQILKVRKVTHMGKFRDASYQGWVTVANLAYIPGTSIKGG